MEELSTGLIMTSFAQTLHLTPIPRRHWPWIFIGALAIVLASSTLVWAEPLSAPTLIAASVSPSPGKPLEQLFASLEAGAAPTMFAIGEMPFVKIAMAFDPPLRDVHDISVVACDGTFRDGIEFFTFPGLERFYAEGGLAEATARLPVALPEMRSLAIGLRKNKDACLKSLVLKNSHGQIIAFKSALRDTASALIAKKPEPSVKLKEAFASANLENVLDQELTPKSEDEHWVFRFRSDGTFFVYGQAVNEEFAPARASADNSREASRFSALGEYKVEQASKSSVKIRLQGERFTTPGPWDGWYCGHSCGLRDPASLATVADPLEIEKLPNGGLVIRNRANRSSRSLPLADMPVRAAIF